MLLLMAMAALPCFAEIRVDREGATVGNITVNQAVYWNDKYSRPSLSGAKEQAKYMCDVFGEDFRGGYFTFHAYYDYEGFYEVCLKEPVGVSVCLVQAWYRYENGYTEDLYAKTCSSRNEAKARFDSLCQRYYNKIPR